MQASDGKRGAGHDPLWSRLAIITVLLLAAALRWVQPGLVEFKYDEVNITRQALSLVNGEQMPILSGGTTLGIQRGALDVYLVALPLALFGRHVEAAVWWLAALGVLAVALTYVLGRRVQGPGVGLMAALFMAVNPWLILYDRKLWAHIQVVFSVLLLILAWDVVVRRRRQAAFWFPVVGALQILAHILAAVQVLSWLGALMVAPRRWWRRETGLGLLAGAALLIPYAWALATRWLARGAGSVAASALGDPAATPVLDGFRRAWLQAFYLFGGAGTSSLAGLTSASHFAWRAADWVALAAALLIAAGLVQTAFRARGGSRAPGARLLLAWTAGPVIVFSLGLVPVPTQYWTVLLPLPALYLALGLAGLGARLARVISPRAAGLSVAAVACIVAVVWAGSYGALLAAVDGGAGARAFGVPLARWQSVLAATGEWAARLGTQAVRVAVAGVDPGYDSEPATVAMLIGNPPWARFVAPQEPAALLLAQDRPSLYLWAVEDRETEALLASVGKEVWQGSLGAGRAPARLFTLPAAASADLGIPVTRLSPEPAFDVGMALVGYAFPESVRAGEEAVITLLWRVLDPPPEVRQRDFTAFNHLITQEGELVGQEDGLALLSRDWWPGDVLVQRYKVTGPEPGAYTWRVGLYSRSDGGRAQLTTGGDHVDLGPLIVQ